MRLELVHELVSFRSSKILLLRVEELVRLLTGIPKKAVIIITCVILGSVLYIYDKVISC